MSNAFLNSRKATLVDNSSQRQPHHLNNTCWVSSNPIQTQAVSVFSMNAHNDNGPSAVISIGNSNINHSKKMAADLKLVYAVYRKTA